MCFNLENFFLTTESLVPSRGLVNLKDKTKVEDIAHMIKAIDLDVCALSEVGGRSSLEEFVRLYLENKYDVHLIDGNSDRGIEVGYLVKKDLPLDTLLISHKDRPLDFIYPNDEIENQKAKDKGLEPPYGKQKFSRNVLELQLIHQDSKQQFNIFLVHFKSQWDRRGDDFKGRAHRQAEVEGLAKIVRERKDQSPSSHIIMTGDFNGRVKGDKTDPEFHALRALKFKDILEVKDLPQKEKFSMVQFNQGQREFIQLDYILIQEETLPLINKEKSSLIRFRDRQGNQIPLPKSIYDRNRLPSDHYPLIMTLIFEN
jgi:endonuclease/exonuclease/phosphatase family metal-dependent hydrolase